MMCLLSLGNKRKRRHGPLMTSGFFSIAGAVPLPLPFALVDGVEAGIVSLAGVSRSFVDLEGAGAGASDSLRISVPGVGTEAKSL